MNAREAMTDLVRRHNLQIEELTERQLIEALIQAKGDFLRYVVLEDSPDHTVAQQVIYLPGREAREWENKYYTLRKACEELSELWNEVAMLHDIAGGSRVAGGPRADCAADLKKILQGNYSPIETIEEGYGGGRSNSERGE
jgi:hypothetical protein